MQISSRLTGTSFFSCCCVQGEVGQSKLSTFPSLDAAKKDFEKKFRDKTKNNWADRENFVAHDGKYTLIEVQHGDEEENEVTVKVNDQKHTGRWIF